MKPVYFAKSVGVMAVASLLALSGCTRDTKAVEHKPTKLVAVSRVAATLRPVWQANLGGANQADPLRLRLARNATTLVAANRAGLVRAWDSTTGRQLWEYKQKGAISSGVGLGSNVAVIGTPNGEILALEERTGLVKWRYKMTTSLLAPALVAQNRVVMMGNDGSTVGLDAITGQRVWAFDVTMPPLSIRGLGAPTLLDGHIVILPSASGRLYGVELQDGMPLWERRIALPQGNSDVKRLIDTDGDAVVLGRNLYAVSYQAQLVAVNLDQQTILWTMPASSLKAPAVNESTVVVSGTDGQVTGFSTATGEQRWQQSGLAWRDLSNPVFLEGFVVVGDGQGYLHILDSLTGAIVGRAQTKGAVRDLWVSEHHLYVQSATGTVSIWQL